MNEKFCKYLNVCGGCDIERELSERKIELILRELAALGYSNDISSPMISCALGGRRRVNFKLDFGAHLGFYRRGTNDVVDIVGCKQLLPEINIIIPKLRILFKSFVKRSDGAIRVTKVDNGIVIYIQNINVMQTDISKIKGFCKENNIIWFGDNKDIYFESVVPIIEFSGVKVPYPAPSFLQPSQEGQNLILNTVIKFMGLKKYKYVCDLFCGLGLFSFELRNMAEKIYAADCDGDAVKAFRRAVASYHISNIEIEERDLFKKALSPERLKKFDMIIIDPPREGAEKQVIEISNLDTASLIYVSCSLKSFIRDVKVLINNGFKIKSIQPIDQFVGSSHIELVAFIEK